MLRRFYLICAIAGTIIPWLFFGSFFRVEGFNLALFITSLFPNGPASGFTIDLLISIVVFWVWSYNDARSHQIKRWWLVIPATFCVGLSLGLPLYLFLREDNSS